MNRRFFSSVLAVPAAMVALAALAPQSAQGQAPAAQKPVAASKAAAPSKASSAKSWTAPRTPDGQPDLQGIWSNATITPLERPAALAGKAFFTEQEAAEFEARAAKGRVDAPPPKPGEVGTYNQAWVDAGTKVVSTRQTSLVVEPPDGIIPIKPWAEKKRDDDLAHASDSWEYMNMWDRCITRGIPGGMFPANYNNAYQILQIPGYVVISAEMIHEVRAIPVDGRPHLPASVRQWNGDSRGHWEGDTLVVDTTNFNGKGSIATNPNVQRIRGIPESEALHVIERFRRVDADTIDYRVTIDDPEVYTRKWEVSLPLSREKDYRIYEYACQEGNTAVENILKIGRAADAAAAKK
jgi:hypothetical protein